MKFVNKFISFFENEDIPFVHYFIGFIFIVLFRNFIELYATKQDNNLYQVLNYSPFYFALAAWFILLFRFFTREKIEKISRIVLVSFSFIIIPPVADTIITWGGSVRMRYIGVADLKSIFESYYNIIFSFKNDQHSIGQRIEIIVITLVSFLYFYFKIKSIWKSVLCAISVYTSIFIFGIFTFVINSCLQYFEITSVEDTLFLAKFYFLITVFVLIPVFYFYKKKYFIALLKDLRYERLTHFFVMLFLGYALFLNNKTDPDFQKTFINSETVFYFFLIPVLSVFAALFTIMINNIQDIKGDRISNKDRPLVTEQIPIQSYKKIAWLALIISLLASLLVNRTCFIMISLVTGSYYIYSCPPFRLKRIPFLSKLIVGINSFLIALLGYAVFGGPVLTFPLNYAFFILVPLSLAGNFLDLKDYEGDKAMGISTLPVIFGLRISKIIISVFTLFSYITIYFIIKDYLLPVWIEFAPILLSVAHIYFLNRKNYSERPVFVTYLSGLIALIIILFNQL